MSKMQADDEASSEDAEMLDLADEPSFQEQRLDETIRSTSTGRSRRRPLPNKWTRIISMDSAVGDDVQSYSVTADLEAATEERTAVASRRRRQWAPLFISNDFLAEYETITLEDFALKKRQLRRIGKQVTLLRRDFAHEAEQAEIAAA